MPLPCERPELWGALADVMEPVGCRDSIARTARSFLPPSGVLVAVLPLTGRTPRCAAGLPTAVAALLLALVLALPIGP